MNRARLLICFAHPDDESFGLGAAIPKWIDAGVEVSLICATNGEVGEVPEHLRGKHKSVADLAPQRTRMRPPTSESQPGCHARLSR